MALKVYIPHDEPLVSGFGSAVAIAKKPTKAKTLKKEERRKYILHIICLPTKMLCPTYSHDESRKGKGRKMDMPFYSISSKALLHKWGIQ